MKITKDYNLEPLNTFRINSICDRYIEIFSENDIVNYFSEKNQSNDYLILSGGSNMLLPDRYKGDILHVNIKGISEEKVSDSVSEFIISAGENWHSFVKQTVEEGFIGLENMALIPGNVGTAPIQNIGAYGVEQEIFFVTLRGYNIETGEFETYSKQECKFGYRDSIFKNKLKGKFIITSVKYRLNKHNRHNTSYNELLNYLTDNNLEINSMNIFNAVVNIRQMKLPDPKVLGNSGSFFKNPIISNNKFTALKVKHQELRGFEQEDGLIKISAGWLIDKVGLKGYRSGNVGVYDKHALIIVNHGGATSEEIINLSNHIINKVEMQFGIKLVPEVNII